MDVVIYTCHDRRLKIILIVHWHNWKKSPCEVKDEKKCGMKYSYKKKVTFQIDFRQKSFLLYSPCTRRYHAFISIRCLTLRIPPSILLIQRSSFYTLDHLWLFRGSTLLFDLSQGISRRGIRREHGTEASNTHVSSRAQPNELSAFFARRALHSFLDCIFVPY